MASSYSPEDQVCCFINHSSTFPAVHVNNEVFKEFYDQRVKEHSIRYYESSTWSSYWTTETRTQIPSTGMSAFADPEKTLISSSQGNEEMNVDEANVSNISDKPDPYLPRDSYRGEFDHTPRTTGYTRINEIAHITSEVADKVLDHRSEAINHAEIKIDAIQSPIEIVIGFIHTLTTTIGCLEKTANAMST